MKILHIGRPWNITYNIVAALRKKGHSADLYALNLKDKRYSSVWGDMETMPTWIKFWNNNKHK